MSRYSSCDGVYVAQLCHRGVCAAPIQFRSRTVHVDAELSLAASWFLSLGAAKSPPRIISTNWSVPEADRLSRSFALRYRAAANINYTCRYVGHRRFSGTVQGHVWKLKVDENWSFTAKWSDIFCGHILVVYPYKAILFPRAVWPFSLPEQDCQQLISIRLTLHMLAISIINSCYYYYYYYYYYFYSRPTRPTSVYTFLPFYLIVLIRTEL